MNGTVIKLSRKASCQSHGGFKLLLDPDFVPKAREGHIAGCNDGTFTSEKRFSKTCGNRGGVRSWLKPYGSCRDGHAIRMSTKATCKGHEGFEGLLADERVPEQFGSNVALCNDGGYSDNLDFDATCSNGDGINVWLAKYGVCEGGAVIKMRKDSSCNTGEFDHLLPGDFEPIDEGYVALCNNGAYSTNADFQGTCESSGGVRSWLATYGKCQDQVVFLVDGLASCDAHGGFRTLLGQDYVPKARVPENQATTTTAPPTTAPPATTAPYVPPTEPYEPPAPTASSGCDPNYSGCVPIVPYDLDCPDINGPVQVYGDDPHGFDGNNDGVGCESG